MQRDEYPEYSENRLNEIIKQERERAVKNTVKEILPQFYNSLVNEFKIKKLAKKYGVDIKEIKLLRQKYVGGKQ